MKLHASGWAQKPELTCAAYLGSARELEFGPKACCSTDTDRRREGDNLVGCSEAPCGPLAGRASPGQQG